MTDCDNELDIDLARADALEEMYRLWLESGGNDSDEEWRERAIHILMEERAFRNARGLDGPFVRPDYSSYLQSEAWRLRANRAKESAGWRCAHCKSGGPLNAHHKTYERLGCELPQDVTPVCRNCHRRIHGR